MQKKTTKPSAKAKKKATPTKKKGEKFSSNA